MKAKKELTAFDILKLHGAKNIKPYDLCNNYGYTFEYNGKRYDARYWANCYGMALNRWDIHDADTTPIPQEDRELLNKIKEELNSL